MGIVTSALRLLLGGTVSGYGEFGDKVTVGFPTSVGVEILTPDTAKVGRRLELLYAPVYRDGKVPNRGLWITLYDLEDHEEVCVVVSRGNAIRLGLSILGLMRPWWHPRAWAAVARRTRVFLFGR